MSTNIKDNETYLEITRYIRDEMSEKERYAFERALERDPFLAEALEGMENFKLSEIERDLNHFSFGQKKGKIIKPIFLISSAAAFLILITATFFLVTKFGNDESQLASEPELIVTPEPDTLDFTRVFSDTLEIADTSTMLTENEDEITVNELTTGVSTLITEKRTTVSEEKAKEAQPEPEIELHSVSDSGQKISKRKEIPKIMAATVAEREPVQEEVQVSEEIASDARGLKLIEDSMPSEQQVEPSVPLANVAPADVDTTNKQIEDMPVTTTGLNAKPLPLGGETLFYDYIEKKLRYPANIEDKKREVVRISFTISTLGDPKDFEIIRSPDNKAFEQEAIRLISNGPKWSPAIEDGIPVEEKVSLRIVFKPED